jgi:hypothetical protein
MRREGLPLILALVSLPLLGQGRPSLDDLKKQALTAVDAREVFTQQMVDQVFSFAELGFQEHESSRYVTEILEKNGFAVERGVAGIPTAGLRPTARESRSLRSSAIWIAFRGRRRNPAWRFTIRLLRARRGTARDTTRGRP